MIGVTFFGIFLTPVFYYVATFTSRDRKGAVSSEKTVPAP